MRSLFIIVYLMVAMPAAWGQVSPQKDTTTTQPAMQKEVAKSMPSEPAQAVYERPVFASLGNMELGGFVEANTNAFVEDGTPDGFSFEFRRFNVFMNSQVSERIKLVSEIEFGHGTQTIMLNRAFVDFEFHRAFVLRGGILLTPIGSYNVRNDAPLWEFVDRPMVTTEIIPTTLSEMGLGVHGDLLPGSSRISYGVYLTNGLSDRVVLNEMGRTRLASGRRLDQFASDNNGSPAYSGRLAFADEVFGEVGVSYYGGIYNTYKVGDDRIDESRHFNVLAFDYQLDARIAELKGEVAYAMIEIPDNLEETFGNRQWGGFLDLIIPVWRPYFFDYKNAVWNLNARLERVDYNMGEFSSTGNNIYDETNAVTGGLSFRPTEETVFKFTYMRSWHKDLFGNPPIKTAGFQFGFATYF
jgi:hypothetical protein